MDKGLVAKSAVVIQAPAAKVWDALVDPKKIKQYMFGTEVASDWQKGSEITWKGEWQGKPYQDKGRILAIEPEKKIQYTHFSTLSGQPDAEENYHTVTINLSDEGDQTFISLAQDNNPDEQAKAKSKENWEGMLKGLKQLLEK